MSVFRDIGLGHYVDDVPSTRFPVYTRGNAGEVYPEVFYPLSYSLASAEGEQAMRSAMVRTGFVSADELEADASVPSGVFAGYAYLNLSLNRVVGLRVPGSDLDAVDRGFMGNSDNVPPHVPHADDKDLKASIKGLRHVWHVTGLGELPELEADKRQSDLIRAERGDPAEATEAALLDTITKFKPIFARMFETHLVVSAHAAMAVGTLGELCHSFFDDRDMSLAMLGGIGDVESAAPAAEMFRLGKMAAAVPEVDAAFEAGVAGLDQRLQELPEAAEFVAEFDGFLERFGSRGPNEWEIACPTWGTEPALPLALIDRMRGADDSHDPAAQGQRLAAERQATIDTALERVGPLKRAMLKRCIGSATFLSQSRERSKTTVVHAIHTSRLAGYELGRRIAARSNGNADDLWYVVIDEFEEYLADPDSFAERIAERRRVRDELARRVPPFTFTGTQPSPETWPLRDEVSTEQVGADDVLTGISGCPGVARGRARIVLDPSDPGDIGPGDVLIAPLTDPSWTPLFVPVEAVVVDVGAQLSHAVIVSRELGIPCAVSVTDATRKIPDGATIEVDGTTGTVTIIELP